MRSSHIISSKLTVINQTHILTGHNRQNLGATATIPQDVLQTNSTPTVISAGDQRPNTLYETSSPLIRGQEPPTLQPTEAPTEELSFKDRITSALAELSIPRALFTSLGLLTVSSLIQRNRILRDNMPREFREEVERVVTTRNTIPSIIGALFTDLGSGLLELVRGSFYGNGARHQNINVDYNFIVDFVEREIKQERLIADILARDRMYIQHSSGTQVNTVIASSVPQSFQSISDAFRAIARDGPNEENIKLLVQIKQRLLQNRQLQAGMRGSQRHEDPSFKALQMVLKGRNEDGRKYQDLPSYDFLRQYIKDLALFGGENFISVENLRELLQIIDNVIDQIQNFKSDISYREGRGGRIPPDVGEFVDKFIQIFSSPGERRILRQARQGKPITYLYRGIEDFKKQLLEDDNLSNVLKYAVDNASAGSGTEWLIQVARSLKSGGYLSANQFREMTEAFNKL